ncbi:MAG: hypothetical protein O2789_06445, partial [Actinomycetota bacterium]|nr:hypothetical protein [Actinomycetota bacterium]
RLGVSGIGRWEELRDSASCSRVPEELAEDFAEFEAATTRAIELRASVTAWRDARREFGGTG